MINTTKTCNCDFCKLHQRIEEIKARRNSDELIALVDELGTAFINTDEDNCRYKSILDGSWDNAEYILTRALRKLEGITTNGYRKFAIL